MKISQFSDKFKVSNDTVRYYMKLNLIIPEKKGGHYYFNQDCERELLEIIKLKKMDFSLQEIKEIFNFKRMGRLTTYQQDNYYQDLYRGKVQDIDNRISELTEAKAELEEEITDLPAKNSAVATIGIDLSTLALFSCPRCYRDLSLTADKVEVNQVIEGSLNCSCGKSLPIKEGILYAINPDKNTPQVEDGHIERYIKSTDPDFIDESYHSLEWLQRQLEFARLSGKVILEPGSGYGHLLRQIYDRLPEDSIYICVDNSPQKSLYLKQLLKKTGKKIKIIFITADLPELPLKKGIVDILIDFTGTSSFSFNNEAFLPELLDRYFAQQTTLISVFIIYHKFGPRNIVSKPYRENFSYDNIKERLLRLGFKFEKEYSSEAITIERSMGEYENFAQLGDQIYAYQVKVKRWS